MYKNLKRVYFEQIDERTVVLHKCYEIEGYLPVKEFTNEPIRFGIEVHEDRHCYSNVVYYDGFKWYVDEKVNCENWDTIWYLTREDEFFNYIDCVTLLHSYSDNEYYVLKVYTSEETETLTF